MNVHRHTIATLAPAALLLSLSVMSAFAQAPNAAPQQQRPAAAQPAQPSAPAGAVSSQERAGISGSFTAANVTPADPFGQIDISKAGTTEQSVRQWAQGLSAAQKSEITGRCGVITNASNESKYNNQTVTLCRNFAAAEGNSPTRTP